MREREIRNKRKENGKETEKEKKNEKEEEKKEKEKEKEKIGKYERKEENEEEKKYRRRRREKRGKGGGGKHYIKRCTQQQQKAHFTMHQQIEPQPSRVPARRRTHLRKSCHGILRAGAPSCRSSLAVLPPGPHHLLHVSYAGVLVVGREGGG